MTDRTDLPRREPLVVHVKEEYEQDTDNFAVIAYVGSFDGYSIRLETFGGYINGWSTFPPDVQEIVRNDLRSVAEKGVQAWRCGTSGRVVPRT